MLDPTMRLRGAEALFFAGQLTGVEGYVESAAMGHIAGTNAARIAQGEEPVEMPRGTMIGALAHYITVKDGILQPINSNWGIVPPAPKKENGKRLTKPERRRRQAEAALAELEGFVSGRRAALHGSPS
jgi:methylenetetrahydrofolate--tRNA-(uracil-5-)-methyltransferase